MVFGPTLTPLDFAGVSPIAPDAASLPSIDLWLAATGARGGAMPAREFDDTPGNGESLSGSPNTKTLFPAGGALYGCCLVYFDDLANIQYIASQADIGTPADYVWRIRWDSSASRIKLWVSENGSTTAISATSTVVLSATTWYFVEWWIDPDGLGQVGVSVNGTDTTAAYTGDPYAGGSTPFCIGSRFDSGVPDESSNCMDGRIQAMFIMQRMATADERTYLRNSNAGRDYSDLGVAGTDGANLLDQNPVFYRLNETSGNSVDAAGNGPDLSPTNSVSSNTGSGLVGSPDDAESVSKIISKEGQLYEFAQSTGANQGTYQATGFRSTYPCVRLDGVNDLYRYAGNISSRASMSAVLVFRTREGEAVTDQGIGAQVVLSTADEAGADKYLGMGYRYSDTIGKAGMMTTAKDGTTPVVVADDKTDVFAGIDYVVGITKTGSVTTMHVRGRDGTVQDITNTDDGASTADIPDRDNWVLGALKRTTESNHAYIDFVEAIVYSEALTDAQLAGVVLNRLNTYGMSSGYATSGVPKMLYQGRKLQSPAYMFTNTGTNFYTPRAVRNSYTGAPTERFSIYYSSDHSAGTSNIGKCDFDYWMGTWTDDAGNNPLFTDAKSVEVPLAAVDTTNNEVLLFPHKRDGTQLMRKLSAVDGVTLVDEGAVLDQNWEHEGYGAVEVIDGRIWHIGRAGNPEYFYAINTSDDWGDSFQLSSFYQQEKNWLRGAAGTLQPNSVFVFRGKRYALLNNDWFAEWSWSNLITSLVYDWGINDRIEGTDPTNDFELPSVFVDSTGDDDLLYMILFAFESTYVYQTNDDCAFFLCAPDMFESEDTTLTPLVTVSNGKISYTTTATTDVADWDATAETLPSADFEIIENTGTDISSWSSGNYYQFECSNAEADLRLRNKTTIDPTQFYIVDFIIEGFTNEGTKVTHPLADAHFSFELTDDTIANGLRLNWATGDSANSGQWVELSAGTPTVGDVVGIQMDNTETRAYAFDITLRIFDYGTKAVVILEGDEGAYLSLDNLSWGSGVKAKLRIENENAFPAKWLRFTRFAVKTGGPL